MKPPSVSFTVPSMKLPSGLSGSPDGAACVGPDSGAGVAPADIAPGGTAAGAGPGVAVAGTAAAPLVGLDGAAGCRAAARTLASAPCRCFSAASSCSIRFCSNRICSSSSWVDGACAWARAGVDNANAMAAAPNGKAAPRTKASNRMPAPPPRRSFPPNGCGIAAPWRRFLDTALRLPSRRRRRPVPISGPPRGVGLGLRGSAVRHVERAAAGVELRAHLVHALLGVVADVLGDAHGAEFRPAHRAEMRGLVRLLGQRLVVELLAPSPDRATG